MNYILYTCNNISSNELKMKIYLKLLVFFGSFLLLGCAKNTNDPLVKFENEANSILIQDISIFNGIDAVLIPNQDVLIENGIIKNIASHIDPIKDIHTISASGKILMPGLIDSHVHLSGSGSVPWDNISADKPYNLSAYLYAGITTVYDLGGLSADLEKLSNQVNKNELIGPDIYHTHIPITVKNSHPIPLTEQMLPWPLKSMVNAISPTIETADEAPKLIEKYVKNEVDFVKIICDQIPPGSPEMKFEELKALIDAAHKQNKKVFVHIGSPQNAVNAVKAGADVLAHGVWRGKLTPEEADIIAQSGIPVIYTIAGFQNVNNIHHGAFSPSTTDSIFVPAKILDPVTREAGKDVHQQKVMNEFFKDVAKHSPHWAENFRLLYSRKVPILIGTDSNLPGTYAGSTYYQEIEILKKYGMTNFHILTGATYLNAKLFLDEPNFGSVAIGKTANLLILNGNPLVDINSLKKPSFIIKKGRIVARK